MGQVQLEPFVRRQLNPARLYWFLVDVMMVNIPLQGL